MQGGQGADVASLEFEGTWELLYTNAVELLAILAINKLPLSPVKIGAVTQVGALHARVCVGCLCTVYRVCGCCTRT
mgnify:CR=1 FL=1